jgi:hypothetical protein
MRSAHHGTMTQRTTLPSLGATVLYLLWFYSIGSVATNTTTSSSAPIAGPSPIQNSTIPATGVPVTVPMTTPTTPTTPVSICTTCGIDVVSPLDVDQSYADLTSGVNTFMTDYATALDNIICNDSDRICAEDVNNQRIILAAYGSSATVALTKLEGIMCANKAAPVRDPQPDSISCPILSIPNFIDQRQGQRRYLVTSLVPDIELDVMQVDERGTILCYRGTHATLCCCFCFFYSYIGLT